MVNSGADLFPFYVLSGAAYFGFLWFLVDVVRAKTGHAYRRRMQIGPQVSSIIAHEGAEAAAAKGDYKEAYRLEQVSREIERSRAETDQFGLSVAKSYPHGLRFFGEYFSHFWWRLFGTYLMVLAVYIALVGINFLGRILAPITRVVLPILL